MIVPNTNSQTIHQMGLAINAVVRQATGRDVVQNIDMDWVTVAQNKTVQVFSNSIPYMFQRTGGGMNIGNARLSRNKVIGGSLAWNQLANFSAIPSDAHGITYSSSDNKSVTINGTATSVETRSGWFGISETQFASRIGHIVMCIPRIISGTITNGTFTYSLFDSSFVNFDVPLIRDVGSSTTRMRIGTTISEGSVADNYTVSFMCFDLTQMFGSTIANYIYSLEAAHSGDGIAWFKKYFPESFYALNTGELLSVSGLVSHDMTGFNQWDEVWENGYITDASGANAYSNVFIRSKNYIRILPDTSYYFHNGGAVSNADVYFYNANKEYLGRDTGGHQVLAGANQIFTTPADAYYMRFYMGSAYGSTYRNNICINFSNPDLNGRYEPYKLYRYPLDSDLVLRGISKLDSNNNLYYDGDVYEHDGKVTRKYGIVDLGTLNWAYDSANSMFNVPFAACKPGTENLICGKYYQPFRYWGGITGATSGIHMDSNLSLYIKDPAYTDAATFKAAMSGVYLVYELATPTTDTADPFTDPQEISPYGTEEYISTGIVPVGNETQYLELSDTNM